MADEKKTYLINVESNLNKYIEEAIKAKSEVDKLTASNKALKESGTASAAEIEKSNADLRNAQKEYNQAKKSVDLQTQANNSNTESRKQLSAVVALEQQRLGSLANQYTINASGQRVLSAEYIQAVKNLKSAKDSVIAYDKAQSDGRSSIGLYSEAIEGAIGKFTAMPGPVGAAATAVKGFGASLKALLLNPIGLAIAAVVAAVAGLIAIFKKFEPVVEAIERAIAGLKAVFTGISNAIIGLITGQKTLGETFRSLGGDIREAYNEGVEWKRLQQELFELTEINAVADAKRKTQIDELLLASKNRSKSEEERIQLIEQALLMEEVQFAEQKKIADAAVELQEKSLAKGRELTDEEIKMLREKGVAYAIELQNRTNISDDEIKALREALVAQEQVNTTSIALREKAQNRSDALEDKAESKREKNAEARAKALEEEEKLLDRQAKLREKIILAEIKDDNERALRKLSFDRDDQLRTSKNAQEQLLIWGEYYAELGVMVADQLKDKQDKEWEYQMWLAGVLNEADKKAAEEQWNKIQKDKEQSDKAVQEKEDTRAQIIDAVNQGIQQGADAMFESKRARLNAEMEAELSNKNLTEAQKTAISKKYAKQQQKIDIGQALINGALAVGNALATVKPFFPAAVIAAAAAAVTAAIQVATIKSQSFEGSGGSASTAIVTSIPAQKVYATPVGSSYLNQPQLTQAQVNTLPNQNLLTAEQIATAISKLPAPVVTVEDINAKVTAGKKVEVRATI